ncbi:MAG: hypothetical protein WA705_12130 [Candidatus Ozemobacteraceae bacterium]
MNGTKWNPPAEKPPVSFIPDEEGEWTLEAEIKEASLYDKVKFLVKRVNIEPSPIRIVVSPPPQIVPIALAVKLGDKEIKTFDQTVDWGTRKVQVQKIDWKGFTGSNTTVNLKDNNFPLLSADAKLETEGPMTVLATVTIRFWSTDPKHLSDETVVFPAVRADLWAVGIPEWKLPYAGNQPTLAISKSQRTFSFPSGNFASYGKDYSCTSGVLSPVMNLTPALNDGSVSAVEASRVNFSWLRTGLPPANGETYIGRFDKPETADLFLNSTLDFGTDGNVSFKQIKFPVSVTPLDDYIVSKIDPPMFSIPTEVKKTLHCLVSSKDVPSKKRDDAISLLSGEYTLSMQKDVTWTVTPNQPEKKMGQLISDEYSFAKSQPGSYTITALASKNLQEAKSSSPAPATLNQVSATAKADVIDSRLIAYPGKDYWLPVRKELTFSTVSRPGIPDDIQWTLRTGEILGTGAKITIRLNNPGENTGTAKSIGTPSIQETLPIHVFDWNILHLDSNVSLFNGKPLTNTFAFSLLVDDYQIPPVNLIPGAKYQKPVKKISKPLPITIATFSMIYRTDPQSTVQVSPLSNHLVATCTFSGPGSMESLATLTIEVTQPDLKKDGYDLGADSVLMGAIAAGAKYSFSFEPVRALVDMTRQYAIGSVTLTVNNQDPLVLTELPASFTAPMELVKPLLTNRESIFATGFGHDCGIIPATQKKAKGNGNTLEVFYQGNVTRKAYWKPELFLSNGQIVGLAETARSIKPGKLEDYLDLMTLVDPSTSMIGQPVK